MSTTRTYKIQMYDLYVSVGFISNIEFGANLQEYIIYHILRYEKKSYIFKTGDPFLLCNI